MLATRVVASTGGIRMRRTSRGACPPPSLTPVTAYCLLLTAYCSLLTDYCLLLTAFCLLLTAYCLLPPAYCLLPTDCCLLLTAYYTLLTAYYSPLLPLLTCSTCSTCCSLQASAHRHLVPQQRLARGRWRRVAPAPARRPHARHHVKRQGPPSIGQNGANRLHQCQRVP